MGWRDFRIYFSMDKQVQLISYETNNENEDMRVFCFCINASRVKKQYVDVLLVEPSTQSE